MKKPWTFGLIAVAIAAAVAGQPPPGALPGVFGEVLDVRVVNLEVVVTDRQGVPVLGLGPGDFRLTVDGEEVSIDYFSEIRGGTVLAAEVAAEGVSGVPALAPGEPVSTSYLVFIDDFFSIATDRDRALEALAEDLPLLRPEDRMAIVAYDGRELEMLSTWSSSIPALGRALETARRRPTQGLKRLIELRQAGGLGRLDLDDIFSVAGDQAFFDGRLDVEERAYVSRLSEQLNRSVAAAAATLRSFAKPPGRKVMLLYSGGWPFIPADFLVGDITRMVVDKEGPFGANLYSRLAETANLLGYTIYPVDVPGLNRELVSVEQAEASFSPLPRESLLREYEVHDTLEYLARQTGGRAFINANNVRALEGAVSDTRSYYWIGFTPDRDWDDRRHRVEVEVASPGLRVRSRGSYLDSSRSREVTMAVESALLFGSGAAAEGLEVAVGEAVKSGRRRMSVPLTVRVPLDEVTFLPAGEERWASELELRVAVEDEDGWQAEIPVIPLALSYRERPRPGQFGTYSTDLRLRRKAHRAVVAVYDEASGRILTSGIDIAP